MIGLHAGSPRMTVGGLGDDLIKRFWQWRSKAHDALIKKSDNPKKSPYFVDFVRNNVKRSRASIPTGTSLGDAPQLVSELREELQLRDNFLVTSDSVIDDDSGKEVGSWGIKKHYVQQTPISKFPPMNYKQYKRILAFDDVVKKLANLNQPTNPPLPKIDGQGYVEEDVPIEQEDDAQGRQESLPRRGAVVLTATKKSK